MKQFLIIQLILYFGWLSCIAVAQLEISGAITGSASFPHVGITCLGNLAVFITSFIRKRLDLEMAARDFLATITGPGKFENLPEKKNENEQKNENGEIFAVIPKNPEGVSVIMLSNSAGMTNSCVRQFMKYIYNAHDVHPVLLKYDTLKDAKDPDSHCNNGREKHCCNCIHWNIERERRSCNCILRINMPQPPEELSGFRVLLPPQNCLECHGYNLKVEISAAVLDALDFEFTTATQKDPICICMPVKDDKWTKLLVRFLKYKDQEDRGAIVSAADAMQSYLDNNRENRAEEIEDKTVSLILNKTDENRDEGRAKEGRAEEIKYKTVSLIVIRLVEIFVNLLLTVFFKVDGFSSALAARRAVRSYVVDSKGNGLPANVFLTSGLVVVKPDSVCQVLKFRGNTLFWLMLLSTFFVNLLCALGWAVVLIAFNGGIGKWYAVPSMAPSKPRVAVIIAAICIGIVLDCFEFRKLVMECIKIFRNRKDISNEVSNGTDCWNTWEQIWDKIIEDKRNRLMILVVIIFQIGFAVALGLNKGIGRWVYGALHLLVWVKWLFGSFILGAYSPEYVPTRAQRKKGEHGGVVLEYSSAQWYDEGSLVYSSSFLLNAVMVGVMGDWAGIWSTWK